jgi:hypothetical protein
MMVMEGRGSVGGRAEALHTRRLDPAVAPLHHIEAFSGILWGDTNLAQGLVDSAKE